MEIVPASEEAPVQDEHEELPSATVEDRWDARDARDDSLPMPLGSSLFAVSARAVGLRSGP
ncbi:hypothetical protein GN958_ATG20480 [Phytophthora infestans]|uniref:Uncharacterized protein n=1 Tax=Phytophthora infestans TaxID=4787 RepID=A0A8S9TN50_PHYIN|nr:hypothetical protein GN958_ATG20480 [Phytophthora infestans]